MPPLLRTIQRPHVHRLQLALVAVRQNSSKGFGFVENERLKPFNSSPEAERGESDPPYSGSWAISPTGRRSRLSYRNVLVTGGTSGIGYAIAKRFVEEEAYSVAIVSRSLERAEKAINSIKKETGRPDARIWPIQGDVRNHEDLLTEMSKSAKATGKDFRFNTLVNCAGMGQSALLVSMSNSSIKDILQTNLESPIAMSKHLLKLYTRRLVGSDRVSQQMKQDESVTAQSSVAVSSCVINVSSLLALQGGVGASVYAASKAGLIAFTRALALEGAHLRSKHGSGPLFRANVIVPGYIDTPMLADLKPEQLDVLKADIPLGRLGSADEVADAAVFLVSNEYANNCVLNLDGGLSAT